MYVVRIGTCPAGIKLQSPDGFTRTKAGALGNRIERIWSSTRYMALVGILDDGHHAVHLRDRLTNDPQVIAKFQADWNSIRRPAA